MEDLVNEVGVGARGEAIGQAANQSDDPFICLPDELIISMILDKIREAKSLCRCSLVSKRFSSLVYQTKNVSVKIPLQIQQKITTKKAEPELFILPGKPLHSVTVPLGFFPIFDKFPMSFESESSCTGMELLSDLTSKFLGKFTSLESLYVEFNCLELDDRPSLNCLEKEPLVKWKIDMKSSSLIFLICPRRYIEDTSINVYAREWGKLDLAKRDLVLMWNRHLGIVMDDSKSYTFSNTPVLDVDAVKLNSLVDKRTFFLGKKNCMNGFTGYEGADYLVVKDAFEGKEEALVEAVVEMFKEIRCISLRGY
ncbi:uncharacterized protein [Coffea arabica]|uniref:Uncharacterized protein isoform X2 n=1 Tax=Coffea arabica TaxID=13443 RepID=A0A6P6SA41_COFAR|nr:uncharacterized protein LOC113688711 [Coffea arabica]